MYFCGLVCGYNGLSEAAKGYVTNLNVLTAAEARLQELSAAQ